ncbi:uncharacterized protein PHACADRAFT_186405 [Phanerochaete carnosa HHB-10118-sp]|uniref:Uncharacterized protein n=1 Tax=Phanerochaete carnosa (strain HHB-10118-sp) TaxID=650164 RepID=K5W006_PHACS|nr:uncharacterized protein PHACADRAFT_186405 [Phanerochaete carnosa HHB-10118-sp]EKM52214.1 hypothetical protein PHACADRAFT_186405 [Phanerochaete carnosa HHB-10118-sp]
MRALSACAHLDRVKAMPGSAWVVSYTWFGNTNTRWASFARWTVSARPLYGAPVVIRQNQGPGYRRSKPQKAAAWYENIASLFDEYFIDVESFRIYAGTLSEVIDLREACIGLPERTYSESSYHSQRLAQFRPSFGISRVRQTISCWLISHSIIITDSRSTSPYLEAVRQARPVEIAGNALVHLAATS